MSGRVGTDLVIDARPTQNEHRHRGIGRYVEGLLSALVAQGEDPAILVHGDRPVPAPFSGLLRYTSRRPHVLRYHGGWLADEALLPIAARIHNWRRLHATDPDAVPDPRLVPLVATVYDLIPLSDRSVWNLMGPLQRVGYRRMLRNLRRAHRVVVISDAMRAEVVSLLGIPAARIAVVYPGIDLERWPFRGVVGTRAGVLFVGAPSPHKNFDLLIRAVARIDGLHRPAVTVVGPWDARHIATMQSLATALGVTVHFEPYAGHKRLLALYQSSAVLALPSRTEGFGLPALEAMASGCPVVVSSAPALVELVGGAGRAVPTGDAARLGDAIMEIAGSPAEQARLLRLGHDRSRRFTWGRSADQFVQLHRSIA